MGWGHEKIKGPIKGDVLWKTRKIIPLLVLGHTVCMLQRQMDILNINLN